VGNASIIDNNGDSLLLFEKNPELKFIGLKGEVSVFFASDTSKLAYSTNVNVSNSFPMPEHGQGYAIKVDSIWEYFWVFDYSSLKAQINSITAELSCEDTELTLEGIIPQVQYYNTKNQLVTYSRLCQVIYEDLQWDDETDEWIDSTVVAEEKFQTLIVVDATPVPTDFMVVDQLAMLLKISGDTLRTEEYMPIALKAHPQAVVTARGNKIENEPERPIEPETTVKRSAP
jgi:hypothetical protein